MTLLAGHQTAIGVVIGIAMLLLGAAFVIGALPSVPDLIREPIATAMLKHGANKTSFTRFLKFSAADWHAGYGYERGTSYSSFDLPSVSSCTIECGRVVQAAFTHTFGLCLITGDVVSARFDKKGKLMAWNLDSAVDGC